MMQYSVYMRHSSIDENTQVHAQRVKRQPPDGGEVRIIKITDKRFGKIELYYGKKRTVTEAAPMQFQFF